MRSNPDSNSAPKRDTYGNSYTNAPAFLADPDSYATTQGSVTELKG